MAARPSGSARCSQQQGAADASRDRGAARGRLASPSRHLEHFTALLKAGKDPRSILDAIQIGAAEVVIETHIDLNFSLPQHCYEYCNTLGWFCDNFAHPQRSSCSFSPPSYLNQAA